MLVVLAFSAYVALAFRGALGTGHAWLFVLNFYAWLVIFAILLLAALLTLVFLFLRSPVSAVVAVSAATPGEAVLLSGPVTAEMRGGLGQATLTLRCTRCRNPFDVADTGARPLFGRCPHCGAQGALPA